MLTVNEVSFSYSAAQPVLRQVSLAAAAGESIGLVGANGVGKSTLMRLLVGLEAPTAGTITVDGLTVEKKHLAAVRKKIGYVFQDSEDQLFMNTVGEDVAFGPRSYGLAPDEVESRVEEALRLTGTAALRHRRTDQLSGGEKKLAAIATILSMKPDLILLDEPSVALDPRNRRALIGVLSSLPCLKIIASHDLDMILDTCSRTVLMEDGRILRDGPTREILTDKALLERCGLELPFCLQGPPAWLTAE